MEEGAGRDVPQQLVTRLAKHKTPQNCAQGDLLRSRDERLEKSSRNRRVSPSVSICPIRKDSCQSKILCDQASN